MRIKLRTAMVAVALVGIGLGGFASVRRWADATAREDRHRRLREAVALPKSDPSRHARVKAVLTEIAEHDLPRGR